MNKPLSPEHQEALRLASPRFFFSTPDPSTPYSERGFEIGDGWFDIVYGMALDIEAVMGDCIIYCTQIKEKFGELRVYVSAHHDDIQEIIDRAAVESRVICEICGATGKRRTLGNLMKTVCDNHSR